MNKSLKQIAIVGMGPGDPLYLTQRALEYINNADIILYDCLVDEIALTAIPEHIKKERIEKKYKIGNGVDIFDQEILRKMTVYADKGMQVTRIKPGDGLNYNSGGMEKDYLLSKGYEVELVPGIPAHFAAANIFQLNLTEIHQSNAMVSCILDNLEEQREQIKKISGLIKHHHTPASFYPMNLNFAKELLLLLQEFGIEDNMPVAVCGDISLGTQNLFKTNLGECTDLLDILNHKNQLPGHFIFITGTYIFQSYVDFKKNISTISKTVTNN